MTKKQNSGPTDARPQIQKFKDAANQVQTDDREETFDRALKKVAKLAPTAKKEDRGNGRT